MDTPTLASIGLATAIGVIVANQLQRKRNQKLAPAIEAALRAQGPLSRPVLSEAVGFRGFIARGKVALALNDMVAQGKVRTIAAPEGTPQLQKVNQIKYEVTG